MPLSGMKICKTRQSPNHDFKMGSHTAIWKNIFCSKQFSNLTIFAMYGLGLVAKMLTEKLKLIHKNMCNIQGKQYLFCEV